MAKAKGMKPLQVALRSASALVAKLGIQGDLEEADIISTVYTMLGMTERVTIGLMQSKGDFAAVIAGTFHLDEEA